MPTSTLRTTLHALGEHVRLRERSLAGHVTSGKLARGRIVVHAAALGSAATPERVVRHAAAVELIHAGALCHDDLVDRSAVRRMRPTVWHEFGPRAAVIAGLDLILRGVAQVAAEPSAVRRVVARATRQVARGQTAEYADRFARDVAPTAYLRRAADKTGALYELAGRLGALAGGIDQAGIHALGEYGAELGMAFQLADDLRDFAGGALLGREAGTDLREGVYTLPVLLTLSGEHPGADVLGAWLDVEPTTDVVAAITNLLRDNGALQATTERAAAHLRRALAALERMPAGDDRTALAEVAHELMGAEPPAYQPDVRGSGPQARAARCIGVATVPSTRYVVGDAFWGRLPPRARSAGSWPRAAAHVLELGAAQLEIADRVTDDAPAGTEGWASTAAVTAAAQGLIVEMIAALAVVPAAMADALAQALLRPFDAAAAAVAEGDGRRIALSADAFDRLSAECGALAADVWARAATV